MRTRVAVCVVLAGVMVGLSGCRGVGSSRFVVLPSGSEETLREDGRVMESGVGEDAVRLEYSQGIDRLVFAGPAGGPNLLEVRDLEMEPDGGGGYRFYGGLYSWVAPQNGENGWVGADGGLSAWPPDPAMDVGPARVVVAGDGVVESETPMDRRGLVQRKRFAVGSGSGVEGASAVVSYALINTGEGAVVGGPWMNTAVPAGGVIGVKIAGSAYVEGVGAASGWDGGVRAWNEDPVERFWSIAEGPLAGGWTFLYLDRASWEGGTKFFVDGASEIAVWAPGGEVGGAWLHRRLEPGLSVEARERLIVEGESGVAVYIDPGSGVVEAELYGAVRELGPGDRAVMREAWRVLPSATPSVLVLEEGEALGGG